MGIDEVGQSGKTMTSWILHHRLPVTIIWPMLAIAGAVLIGRLLARLDYTYTSPGQPGYLANLRLTERFGIDPAFEATLSVINLPFGKTMTLAFGAAVAERTFAAAHRAGQRRRLRQHP